MKNTNRRTAIKNLVAGSMALAAAPVLSSFEFKKTKKLKLKGNINHSVCQWIQFYVLSWGQCKPYRWMEYKGLS